MGFGENLGFGEWLVIGLSVLIGAWFLVGTWMNNQRSEQTMRWLKQGLAVFGPPGRAQLSVPDSRGIRFKLEAPAQAPLKNLSGILQLERRENLPLWGFELLRGKRDTLAISADTRRGPAGDLRAFHSSNLGEVAAAREGKAASLTFIGQQGQMQLFARGEASPELVERVRELAETYPHLFLEISFQQKSPNLTLRMRLSALARTSPEEFFKALEIAVH